MRKKLAHEPRGQLLLAPQNSDSSAPQPRESTSCNTSLGIAVSALADKYLLKASSLWSTQPGAKSTDLPDSVRSQQAVGWKLT